MNKAEKASAELKKTDELASGSSILHRMHPAAKLIMILAFITVTVSFDKYSLSGIAVMCLFPVIGYRIAETEISLCFRKLWAILPIVGLVGLFNPLFDRQTMLTVGNIPVSGGWISFLTLAIKGVLCLTASFLLAATTPAEDICGAMRRLFVPKTLVTLIFLTWRYAGILLDEAGAMTATYNLRAPGQKGVKFSLWGPFLGQLLLRSRDRADALYESMLLRGFDGEFRFAPGKYKNALPGTVALIIMLALFVLCRIFNIAELIGSLINLA